MVLNASEFTAKKSKTSNILELLYTIILYSIQPLICLRLLLRSCKIPAYRKRWAERYGYCHKKVAPNGILLHSVSVGETLAAIPLIRALRYRYPSLPITITTMTPSGSERVISTFGNEVYHVYLPYDLPCAMNRFFNALCPKLVIVVETELWPNMIAALHTRKIPLVIVNARLSDRSIKRYSKLGKFMQCLLSRVTLIAAQDTKNGTDFALLGLNRDKLAVIGSLKFDISVTPELAARAAILRRQWATHRQVWIATSTHDGEEAIILQAHRALLEKFPNLLLILVPRHPERFSETCKIVQKAGFSFMLRSNGGIPSDSTLVIIGDTMGELMLLYGIADLAFVGGSLVNHGGHNPLEPAAHAVPILMGPYTHNFRDICDRLKLAGGLITVTDIDSVVKVVSNLLIDKHYRLLCGRHAIEFLYQNQGALHRLLSLLQPYLPSLQS